MKRVATVMAAGVAVCWMAGCDDANGPEETAFELGAAVWQAPMGSGVNIHDMALAGGKAYVTRYGASGLLVIRTADGSTVTTIDLSAFGVDTGNGSRALPYMHAAMTIRNRVYVQCQRLTIQQGLYGPTPMPCDSTGLLVAIDTASDQIASTIVLGLKNPAAMDTAGGYLYVSCSGAFYEVDNGAGIERVDLATGAVTQVASETAFGGDISTLVMAGPGRGYVQVMNTATFTSQVMEFDPATGAVRDTLPVNGASGGMAFDGRYLYVGDRGTSSMGVAVFDTAGNVKVGATLLADGMPPYSLAVVANAGGQPAYVAVGTSDYQSGNLGLIHLSDWTAHNNLKPIHNDNKVVGGRGCLYVLELFGQDRITRYDLP